MGSGILFAVFLGLLGLFAMAWLVYSAVTATLGAAQRARFSIVRFVLAIPFWPFMLAFALVTQIGDAVIAVQNLFEALISTFSYLIACCSGILASTGHDEDELEERRKARQARHNSGREMRQNFELCIYHLGRPLMKFLVYAGFLAALESYERAYYDLARARSGGTLPAVETQKPGSAPAGGRYEFEDRYAVLGELETGGSTARLFKVQRLHNGAPEGPPYVLKYFDLISGSQLEYIVRESSAVQLAQRMGVVADAVTTQKGYYYVMPFYEGRKLTREVSLLHREIAEGQEIGARTLQQLMHWMRETLLEVSRFHRAGLFHKDIKPDNIIVNLNHAHLVDLGLVTPLDSHLQLTTHGTEYFRDPQMVKLAIQGVKVRDTDCVKFDLYSLGATLYYMLEGSFPASGSLSRYTKRVPFALQCIANKAMTDMDKRYAGADAMLRDLEDYLYLGAKQGWYEARVGDLYSFSERYQPAQEPLPEHVQFVNASAAAGAQLPLGAPSVHDFKQQVREDIAAMKQDVRERAAEIKQSARAYADAVREEARARRGHDRHGAAQDGDRYHVTFRMGGAGGLLVLAVLGLLALSFVAKGRARTNAVQATSETIREGLSEYERAVAQRDWSTLTLEGSAATSAAGEIAGAGFEQFMKELQPYAEAQGFDVRKIPVLIHWRAALGAPAAFAAELEAEFTEQGVALAALDEAPRAELAATVDAYVAAEPAARDMEGVNAFLQQQFLEQTKPYLLVLEQCADEGGLQSVRGFWLYKPVQVEFSQTLQRGGVPDFIWDADFIAISGLVDAQTLAPVAQRVELRDDISLKRLRKTFKVQALPGAASDTAGAPQLLVGFEQPNGFRNDHLFCVAPDGTLWNAQLGRLSVGSDFLCELEAIAGEWLGRSVKLP